MALAISGLLHISVLVAAYLGDKTREGRPLAVNARMSLRPFTASMKAAQRPTSDAVPKSAAPVERTQGIDLLPLSALPYYPTPQLTKRPQPLASADLDPPEIRLMVASGKIILKLWIDEFGEVVEVAIEKSELPEVFTQAAITAFRRLRFTPGERGGVRVGSVMKIEVDYADGRLAAPGG